MDDLERPIAARLRRQIADQGLRVDHLACPAWDNKVPAELTCEGWFDGVAGSVRVSLRQGRGGQVTFDAELQEGVIATESLVDELTSRGYGDVHCGSAPAYPADVGAAITCSVTDDGVTRYLVATVTDTRGGVTISDF